MSTELAIDLHTYDNHYWTATLAYNGDINKLIKQLVREEIQSVIAEERGVVREAFKADGRAIRELVRTEIRDALNGDNE